MNQIKTIVVHRLSEETLKDLERRLPPALVDDSTSILVAGQKLGVQLVLKHLREGFVTS